MNSSLCLSYNNILIFPVFPICQLQRTDTYNQIINKRGTADRTKKLINIPVCDEHGLLFGTLTQELTTIDILSCTRCWLSTVWYLNTITYYNRYPRQPKSSTRQDIYCSKLLC
jgi:hypothetical protein